MAENAPRPSILVVDDESLVRSMAVDMFEEAGFHVLEASSGEKALSLIQSCDGLAALFTDVELGNSIDGIYLARVVHGEHPGAAIMVVSGQHVARNGELPRGARFLAKPYDPDAVTKTLHAMLASDGGKRG